MCGRYNVTDDPALRALLDYLNVKAAVTEQYNITPTENVPVVRQIGSERELRYMHWWLIPHWLEEPQTTYAMFNARAEGLAESRAFRAPFKRQRCIFPVSSFIEWRAEDGKQPYLIQPVEGALAVAGIWERWGEEGKPEAQIHSCAMITTDAVPGIHKIHARMPVMLPADALSQWLDPAIDGRDLLPLLLPQLPVDVTVQAVERRINNGRVKERPELIGEPELIGRCG